MAPLVKAAAGKQQWWIAVTAYTVAGGVASAFVGVLLGSLGRTLMPGQAGDIGFLVGIAVAIVAVLRELGWLAIPVPQVRRQTQPLWAKRFPPAVSAALWGFDLGLVFTTWLTFSGVWLLVAVAIVVGEPGFAAALFVSHWLGRALAVWVVPLLKWDEHDTPRFLNGIDRQRPLFRQIHVLALVWAVIVLALCVVVGAPSGG